MILQMSRMGDTSICFDISSPSSWEERAFAAMLSHIACCLIFILCLFQRAYPAIISNIAPTPPLGATEGATISNATTFEIRNPDFVDNVVAGVYAAERISRSQVPFELFMVKNYLRSNAARPHGSYSMDDFTMIELEVLKPVKPRPLQLVKYDLKGGNTWGRWENTLKNSLMIDAASTERRFGLEDITMSDVDAAGLLRQRNLGPWTSVNLCVPFPNGPLTYAFQRPESSSSGTSYESEIWDLVQVRERTTRVWTGRIAYCLEPKPGAADLTANVSISTD